MDEINLLSQANSPLSMKEFPLDKHIYRAMQPKVNSFKFSTNGNTESIKRLNPHKRIVNGEELELPLAPEIKSESPKTK